MSITDYAQEGLRDASDAEHVTQVARERFAAARKGQQTAREGLAAMSKTMVGGVASEMFRPKTTPADQKPVIITDQQAADRVMQAGDFALLDSDPAADTAHNAYVRAVADLDPSRSTTITPESDEQQARQLVSQALIDTPAFSHPDLQQAPVQHTSSEVMQVADAVNELFAELGIDDSIFNADTIAANDGDAA